METRDTSQDETHTCRDRAKTETWKTMSRDNLETRHVFRDSITGHGYRQVLSGGIDRLKATSPVSPISPFISVLFGLGGQFNSQLNEL